MKFFLKQGFKHHINGKTYQGPAYIESDKPLHSSFPTRFELVSVDEDEKDEAHDGRNDVAGKKKPENHSKYHRQDEIRQKHRYSALEIVPRGNAGWYDVYNPASGKYINRKACRQYEAEEIAGYKLDDTEKG